MSLKSFLKNIAFWKSLLIAVMITVVLLFSTIFILKIYTDHGESFPVPQLNGLNEKQVAELIAKEDLRYQILDSLFLKNKAPGTVVDQVPKAGAKVKKNRTVFITICALNPEPVTMPKLTDISYRQALNVMESTGLIIGKIEYQPSEFNDLVLSQKLDGAPISVGALIAKGSKIDLVIGQTFTGEKTEVPQLIGSSLQESKETLGNLILNFGAVIYDDSFTNAEDSASAKIWKQRPSPSPNLKINQGQSIDIWLTADEDKIEEALEKNN